MSLISLYHIVLDCDDEDIQTKYRCGMNCEWMNNDGWCAHAYNVTYPRCALRNVTNHCPKSCGECGKYQFSFC